MSSSNRIKIGSVWSYFPYAFESSLSTPPLASDYYKVVYVGQAKNTRYKNIYYLNIETGRINAWTGISLFLEVFHKI